VVTNLTFIITIATFSAFRPYFITKAVKSAIYKILQYNWEACVRNKWRTAINCMESRTSFENLVSHFLLEGLGLCSTRYMKLPVTYVGLRTMVLLTYHLYEIPPLKWIFYNSYLIFLNTKEVKPLTSPILVVSLYTLNMLSSKLCLQL
jgi:hypothetical protein